MSEVKTEVVKESRSPSSLADEMMVSPNISSGDSATTKPRPLRILMTADTVGGVWNYALDLARELAKLGVDVALAIMGGPLSASQAADASQIRSLTIYESSFKLEWMRDPWNDVDSAGDWLLNLERDLKPDIIHLNGFVHGSLPWESPALIVAHSCVLSWWRAVKHEQIPANWKTYQRRVSEGIRSADCVVAPTRVMLDSIRKHYGHHEKTRVIPNGRDKNGFTPRSKENFILTAGRLWDEAKNVKAVVDAAISLPWQFFIAGAQVSPDVDESVDSGSDNVHFVGNLSPAALSDLYGRASVYVLPAKYEPFGLSVLEAALSGCALVLGDIPSLRENWDGAALFVEPEDREELKYQLNRLMTDTPLRSRMARIAESRTSTLTAERMAREYYSLYSGLKMRSPVSPAQEAVECAL